jgi:hypothetical protein
MGGNGWRLILGELNVIADGELEGLVDDDGWDDDWLDGDWDDRIDR